jgi:hypothetical protein
MINLYSDFLNNTSFESEVFYSFIFTLINQSFYVYNLLDNKEIALTFHHVNQSEVEKLSFV